MEPKPKRIKYEFGGPLGAAIIVFVLPVLVCLFFFACNDVSGCPAPSLLNPHTFTWKLFKSEIPWPENGLAGFVTLEATCWTLAYYVLSLALHRVLPAQRVLGTKLRESGLSLEYRFNSFSSTLVQLSVCVAGTCLYGADFIVWTWIDQNYLQLLAANIILSYTIGIYVYVNSYSVTEGNSQLRELSIGGRTGNLLYDFFIGRELNPRVLLPVFGEVDMKTWMEMRPGLTGWLLLDLAFVAKQYRNYSYISDSMVFVTAIQAYYVLEGQYAEEGLLCMTDTITDGLGFMLSFGDIVWVPFIYSTQCRYLAIYPTNLGWFGRGTLGIVFAIGLYIFRASNNQKALFRKTPNHPNVNSLSYLDTKRGTRLLTSGWWGAARHINYFGDWMQSLAFNLAAGFSGYIILPAGAITAADGYRMANGSMVVQGAAKGWGVIFTMFHALYFAALLIHRERRDDAACAEKYGTDWEKYKSVVRWKLLPGVY